MEKHSSGLKEGVLCKLAPPANLMVGDVAEAERISAATLSNY